MSLLVVIQGLVLVLQAACISLHAFHVASSSEAGQIPLLLHVSPASLSATFLCPPLLPSSTASKGLFDYTGPPR